MSTDSEATEQIEFFSGMSDYYRKMDARRVTLIAKCFEYIAQGPEECAPIVVCYEGGGDSGDFFFEEGTDTVLAKTEDGENFVSCADLLVAHYYGGWENNEGGGGTVTFTRDSIQLEHYDNVLEREYSHSTVWAPGKELEVEETTPDPAVQAVFPELSVAQIIQGEKDRQTLFRINMLGTLKRFLKKFDTFLALRCYTPMFNDGMPCENTISFCQFGMGEHVAGWNNFTDDDGWDDDGWEEEESGEDGEDGEDGEEKPKKGITVEMSESDKDDAEALLSWFSDDFSALTDLLGIGRSTDITLFVRVDSLDEFELAHSEYNCGY
jgi:hypothetical protein